MKTAKINIEKARQSLGLPKESIEKTRVNPLTLALDALDAKYGVEESEEISNAVKLTIDSGLPFSSERRAILTMAKMMIKFVDPYTGEVLDVNNVLSDCDNYIISFINRKTQDMFDITIPHHGISVHPFPAK